MSQIISNARVISAVSLKLKLIKFLVHTPISPSNRLLLITLQTLEPSQEVFHNINETLNKSKTTSDEDCVSKNVVMKTDIIRLSTEQVQCMNII